MKAFLMKLLKNKVNNTLKSSDSKDSLAPLFMSMIFGGSSFIFFFLGFIVLIVVIISPVFLAAEYFNDDNNKVVAYDLCGDTCGENEQKFYSKLEEVRTKYKSKGVNIDTNLISGTVFYGSTLNDEKLDTSDSSDDLVDDNKIHVSDVKVLASNMVSGSSIDYNKYRNYLVNTYIPKRFSHLYNNSDKEIMIQRIADDIMSYAEYNSSTIIAGNFSSIGLGCSSITLRNGSSIEVLDLEAYVAGVVSGENDYGVEAAKLQAIAARTNAVSHCNEVIDNTTNFQFYKSPSESGMAAAEATKGLVLTYNGELLQEMPFASYPMAFYQDPNGFPGYYAQGALCGDVVCGDKADGRRWCQTTLYKVPNLESFTLDMPDRNLNGGYWNDYSLSNQKGHCYGVSQVATRYYESELNYTYEQMIEVFFSDGVEVSAMASGFSGETASTDGTSFLPYELSRFLSEKGTSVDAFNESIKQSVISAGPGTRAGVVASVNALVNGLSQYGVKLPYISSISGQYMGKYDYYGVDPTWGENGYWYSAVYGRPYNQLGLDCSGLVVWAIHNGGFKNLKDHNSSLLHNDGTAHAYGTFTGQPGDLLWVSGHIGIIIDIDGSNYVVAEEHGGENGLEITRYNMNSSRVWADVVDMTSFYSNTSNLELAYYQGG